MQIEETQIAVTEEPPLYVLAKITAVDATVNELVKRYDGVIYDVTTTKGMATAKADRAALRTARGVLEGARKEEKADVLSRGRFIDSEAARIGITIAKYEDPLAEQIKTEEDRKEKEKAEKAELDRLRIAAIIGNIEQIKSVPANVIAMTAAETSAVIIRLQNLPIGDAEYQEFRPMAQEAKIAALQLLSDICAAKLTQEAEAERIEGERVAEAARVEAVQVERDRLAAVEAERLKVERETLEAEQKEFERLQGIENEKSALLNNIQTQIDYLNNIPIDAFSNSLNCAQITALIAELDAYECAGHAAVIVSVEFNINRLQRLFDKVKADAETARKQAEFQQAIDDAAAKEEENRKQDKLAAEIVVYREKKEAEIKAINEEGGESGWMSLLKSEYARLLRREAWADALDNAGVDNWQGHDSAVEIYQEYQREAAL